MKISLIAAIDENRAIGFQGKMPWHLPADLRYFRKNTLGKPVVMGRKTFESIGTPLRDRINIVITHQTQPLHPGVTVLHDLESVWTQYADAEEICIIGGATLYAACLPIADRLYLTQVHTAVPIADTYFPPWDIHQWSEISCSDHLADPENKYAYTFRVLERIQS